MQEEATRYSYVTIQPEYLEDYNKMEIKLNVKNAAVHQKGKLEELEEYYVTLYQELSTNV
jgi:hypothetical protein